MKTLKFHNKIENFLGKSLQRNTNLLARHCIHRNTFVQMKHTIGSGKSKRSSGGVWGCIEWKKTQKKFDSRVKPNLRTQTRRSIRSATKYIYTAIKWSARRFVRWFLSCVFFDVYRFRFMHASRKNLSLSDECPITSRGTGQGHGATIILQTKF